MQMIKRASKIIAQSFDTQNDLVTEMQFVTRFKDVYTPVYYENAVLVPKIMLCVRQICIDRSHFDCYPHILNYILGGNYKRDNLQYRLNVCKQNQLYLSHMATVYSQARDYGLYISEYEKSAIYYKPHRCPNPLTIIFSKLIGYSYLPPTIWNCMVTYNGLPIKKILELVTFSNYDDCWKAPIVYNTKITRFIIMDILRVLKNTLEEPYASRLHHISGLDIILTHMKL